MEHLLAQVSGSGPSAETLTSLREQLRGVEAIARREAEARRSLEARARECEERFRELVDEARDYAIFKLDPNGRVLSWNAGAARIKGYSAEEIIGQHFSRFYAPEDVAAGRPERALRIASERGRFEDHAVRVRKDGTRFFADVVISAVRDPEGRLRGFTKITRDITEQHRAAEVLQQSEESLSTTLNSIGDGVIATDSLGRVSRLNPVAERLTGWRLADALGKPVTEVFHVVDEDTGERVPDPVERALSQGVTVGLSSSAMLVSREGVSRAIADSCAPIRAVDGRITGAVLIFRDVTTDRRAEEALRHSEQNLAITLNSIGDAVIATNIHGEVQRMNPAAERLTGWALAEANGKPLSTVFQLINERTGAPAPNPVQRALREGVPGGLEPDTAILRRDGSRRAIADSCAPIRNLRDQITGAVLVFRDVTAEREAEQALRESEERFRLLVDRVSDYAIFMLDPDGRVATWNAGAQRIKGYSAEEILGRDFSIFYPEEDRARGKPQEELRRAAERGSSEEEGIRVRKDGSRFWANVVITALRDGDRLRGFSKVTRDITAQRQARLEREELLAQLDSERRWLRTMLRHLPIGVVLLESASGRLEANPKAEELLGVRTGAMPELSVLWERVRAGSGDPLVDEERVFHRALAGERIDGVERVAVPPDGKPIPLLMSSAPIRGPDEGVLGAVVVLMDTTALKQLEQLREEWTSLVAHDLKQPINNLSLFLSLLARRDHSSADAKAIAHMQTSLRRLDRMVGDLRDFALLEARRLELRRAPVDLGRWLAQFAERHALEFPGHPIALERLTPLPNLETDPDRLEQILMNLVSNGAKYGFADSEIRLGARRVDGRVQLSVTNHGEGLKECDLDTLFDRFTRCEGAARKAQGLGLGLYISRGLVEALGGRIWAESSLGKTTAFHLALPVAEGHPLNTASP